MRAIVVTRTGGPEVLDYAEVPDPTPGPTDLLVRVQAAGINYIDTYFRNGTYPRERPYVPGDEGTGIVEKVGSSVTEFSVGDRVAWAQAPGSYADLVVVRSAVAVAVPDAVEPAQAASVLLQGMTAHYLIESTYAARAGDAVLVHAGAGGVGLLLTQLAVAKGVIVITTVSSDEKESMSRAAGASHALRYDADIAARVRELTDGLGVAAVYDGVGKTTYDASLNCVRVRGTVALFGAASGPVPPVDPQRLSRAGSVFLTRPTIVHHLRDRAELLWRSGDVMTALANGTLSVRVEHRYPLAEARQAHTDLESRTTTGSLVLIP